jgi:hypothetical protein
MSELTRALYCMFIACGIAGCAASAVGPSQSGPQTAEFSERGSGQYAVPKQIRYGFTLQNTTARTLNKTSFHTYAPVRQTSNQLVKKITASHPYRLSTDDLGNQILHFEFNDLPSHGTKVVTITIDLLMAQVAVPMSTGEKSLFLAPEPYIESDDAHIRLLAKTLQSNAPVDSAQRVFEWVAGNLKTEMYIPDDRGARYALEQRHGDCTEYAYLFTALNRANGIPTRAIGGYVFEGNAIVKAPDYHNWAEFYADGAWHVVDPLKRNFLRNAPDYVAMRVISTKVKNALGNSHRFSYASGELRVSMN